jgi:hypothetical protein
MEIKEQFIAKAKHQLFSKQCFLCDDCVKEIAQVIISKNIGLDIKPSNKIKKDSDITDPLVFNFRDIIIHIRFIKSTTQLEILQTPIGIILFNLVRSNNAKKPDIKQEEKNIRKFKFFCCKIDKGDPSYDGNNTDNNFHVIIFSTDNHEKIWTKETMEEFISTNIEEIYPDALNYKNNPYLL